MVSALQADPDFVVVAEFSEGRAAIAVISNLSPDMILIDLGLPDICGIKVIERMKQTCPECDVLVVTGFNDERTIMSALEAQRFNHKALAAGPGGLTGCLSQRRLSSAK
jgi:DNA-binding NarL/FixJ family response regulator